MAADQPRDASHLDRPSMLGRFSAAVSTTYAVEREIGRGGMATVYLARDVRTDSRVALKVLHPDLAQHVASERFAREIRITAGLQHENILPVLDSGEADGVPYYAMPYVDGESLADRIAREKQLPIADALEIAQQIARALAYAHARGYLHRDIKPANILLSNGRAIVADFGIARAIDASASERITESGLVVGTALYMSPEQGNSSRLDGRSDIYSVGCLLFEMLVGTPPFVGSTPQSVLARHAVDPPPSVRTVRGTVSPAVEALIAKSLAKVPADRYADATAFALAIEEATRAQAAHRTATAGRAATRRRTAIAAAGIVVAAIAGSFAWRGLTPGATLDRHRITVFPLAVSAGFKGSPAIGEDVATIVGHVLDGTGSLRWIDGWRLLSGATLNRSPTATDPVTARRLARAQRCGFYLSGSVVPYGDSVVVNVDLIDVAGDSLVKSGHASAAAADAWRAGLRAVNGVLPALVPDAASRDLVSEWVDRGPDAVAHFLLGEAAFRRARAPEALTHYREAVRLDSTFALAAVRGAQAASWDHRAGEADSLIRRAIGQKMAPRFTHFGLGFAAYLDGRPDSAIAELRRALAIDPEMSVAWMQLGETYTHLLPANGRSDTLADAAFNEAMRLDSSAVHMLLHPIEIRERRGQSADAAPLLARFLAAQPDTLLAAQLRIMHSCVAKGPSAVAFKDEVIAHPLAVLFAGQSLAIGGRQLDCAEAAYTALRTYQTTDMAAASPTVDNSRWTALVGLTGILIAEGRVAEAIAHVDSSMARAQGGASLYLVGVTTVASFAAHAAEAARQIAAQAGAACERCTVDRTWQMGVWAASRGDTLSLATFAAALAARTADRGARLLARATEAKRALARHDTTAALHALRDVLREPADNAAGELVWKESLARGPERLAYARLLFARRDFQQAIEVADTFDSPGSQSYVAFLPASLELRAAAADSANLRALGDWYRGRLRALRAHRLTH